MHYHDFSSRSAERGVGVISPEFEGFGNHWCVRIYPGGSDESCEGKVSLRLINNSNKAIEIYYGFSVNDGEGKQVAYKRYPGPHHFGPVAMGSTAMGGQILQSAQSY